MKTSNTNEHSTEIDQQKHEKIQSIFLQYFFSVVVYIVYEGVMLTIIM